MNRKARFEAEEKFLYHSKRVNFLSRVSVEVGYKRERHRETSNLKQQQQSSLHTDSTLFGLEKVFLAAKISENFGFRAV
jgi:hypothetical protein